MDGGTFVDFFVRAVGLDMDGWMDGLMIGLKVKVKVEIFR